MSSVFLFRLLLLLLLCLLLLCWKEASERVRMMGGAEAHPKLWMVCGATITMLISSSTYAYVKVSVTDKYLTLSSRSLRKFDCVCSAAKFLLLLLKSSCARLNILKGNFCHTNTLMAIAKIIAAASPCLPSFLLKFLLLAIFGQTLESRVSSLVSHLHDLHFMLSSI